MADTLRRAIGTAGGRPTVGKPADRRRSALANPGFSR